MATNGPLHNVNWRWPVFLIWHYTYDRYGQQLSQTDPYNHTTTFSYDPLTGQRIGRTLPAVDGVTVSESWQYDALGRQVKRVDFNGQGTTFHYDSLGRIDLESRFAAGQDPNTATPNEKTEYRYDPMGRRDQVTLRNASGAITRLETYGYDDQSRLTSISAPEGTIHYAYDPITGQLTDTWTSSAVDSTAQQSSTWTQYAYDALGRLSTVTAKRLLGQDQNLVTTYSYDKVGNLASVVQPNGVLTSYTYDALNRLDLETVTHGASTLASYDYVLLPDGQRDYVLETDSLGGQTKIDWTYDAADRLISETRDEGNDGIPNGGDYTDSYTLDLVGNRLEKEHDAVGTADDETITSTYTERDQLITEDSTIDAHDASYTYDHNGSQLTKTTQAGTITYAWDLQNHLVGIHTNGDADTDDLGEVRYEYNSDGVRVREVAITDKDGDGTLETRDTRYLNDPQNPTGYVKAIEDHETASGDPSEAGASAKAYILGMQVIGQANSASDIYFLLLDGHGSTRAVTDATTGIPVETYHYDAFGTPLNFDANTAKTNWLFGGDGLWDPNSRFTYHLARFRDGARFVSYDSYEADPSTPANLHKYTYANANPVYAWDPTGQMGLGKLLFVVGVIALVASYLLPPMLSVPKALGMPLGWKASGIYGWRLTKSILSLGIGGSYAGWGGLAAAAALNAVGQHLWNTYYFEDDRSEMTTALGGRETMAAFYAREALAQGVGPDWRTYQLDIAFRTGDPRDQHPTQPDLKFLQIRYGANLLLQTLGGSHGGTATGSFRARRDASRIYIDSIDVDWHWIDAIDTNWSSGDWGEKAWGVTGEPALQIQYNMDVHWRDVAPDQFSVPTNGAAPVIPLP